MTAASAWYEDLYRTCEHSGTGSVPSVTYKPNGESIYGTSHQKSFRLLDQRSGKQVKLYGILDGFEDSLDVAEFVAQRLIDEILPFDHTAAHVMNNNPTDSQIIKLLNDAFQKVDNAYFSVHIGETLAQRCWLQMYARETDDIQRYNELIKGRATALIALIYDNKLFVANLGDSRAVIVKQVNGEHNAIQMSNWHDPTDRDEQKRLQELGLNYIATPTRCFGDFFRKGGYKENQELKFAAGEPVLAEPSVHGSVLIDDSLKFLILVNGGVVHSIIEQNTGENVNVKIASLIMKEFAQQGSMTVTARAALDCIAREHQLAFTQRRLPTKCVKRRDMIMIFTYLSDFALENTLKNSVLVDEEPMKEVATGQIPLDDMGRVAPFIDFSEFDSHPKKAEVLKRIASIIEKYAKKKKLTETDEGEECVDVPL